MSISSLYIDDNCADSSLTESIKSHLNVPAETISDARTVFERINASEDPIEAGKHALFLTENKGAFVRQCPGTRAYTCCGYKILHIGTYCTMDCSYCILQAYFHPPVLQLFTNHGQMMDELDQLFSQREVSRIGTGEFTDSLIWENWSPFSTVLVPKFASQSRAVLELKTKTVAVDKLKSLDHNRKTIISWSLNTDRVIRRQERGTAPLEARLKAAARCVSWGYPVAFHFDPMVVYDGCEAEYQDVIRRLLTIVKPENIVWISLGTFRFIPTLKSIIQRRFEDSRIVYGEFVPGLDGKMRYFKPIRTALYRSVASVIQDIAPDICVYFCMETDEVWQKALGFHPLDRGGLPRMLDEAASRHCGLDGDLTPWGTEATNGEDTNATDRKHSKT